MPKKILVTYATFAGSTAEVAQKIAEALRTKGAAVEVQPVKEVSKVDVFDAVILGSAIRGGKIHPNALKFLEKHQEELSHIPVAYFVCCMTMSEDTQNNRYLVQGYLEEVFNRVGQIKPFSLGMFGGDLEFSKLDWISRIILRAAHIPQGDHRDWKAIEDWANQISTNL